ncbi:MAG: hypothetical protein KAJ19_23485 [Gammaproteobacteria bacterium]|nr:hypothetical protein [Gammaproteobacteria bacterium]
MKKSAIEDIKSRYEDQLLNIQGVVGVATGKISTGEIGIKVLVIKKTPELDKIIPKEIEDYKVEIEEVGVVKAL